MDETHVVTCFLRNGGDVLLLRRSDAVGSYAGQWGGVAGHAEGTPDTAACEEIAEETSLDGHVTLVRVGESFPVSDTDLDTRWVVHPYLIDCESREVVTNDETTEHEWCPPTEILRRETVPDLWKSYDRVRPTHEDVAGDETHGSTYVSLRALEVLRDEAALTAESEARSDPRDHPTATYEGRGDFVELARRLRDAHPSMQAVANRVNRVMWDALDEHSPAAVERAATDAIERAVEADMGAATTAADLVGERVLTLSRSGTVRAAIDHADPETVFVAESRPACEGRDVAAELAADYTVALFVDAAVGHVLATEAVDAVLVGADAVLADGSVVNKVGTYPTVLAAAREGVPVYAVAATAKVATDDEFHVEVGSSDAIYDGVADLDVRNPTFDRTPADLVAGVATEAGLLDADDVRSVADEHARLAE